METLAVVCLVATLCGWSAGWPSRRVAPAPPPDVAPAPDAGRRPPQLLTVADPWKDSDSQEWEHSHRHPRRMSVLQPGFNTQHGTPPAASAPYQLLVNKGNNPRATQDLLEQEILETPLYINDAVGPSDPRETVFIRNVAESSENAHAPRNRLVDQTSHSLKSLNKRKNIFQLIKHLELALDNRRRKNRRKPSEERTSVYKIRKEQVHHSAAPVNETYFVKHYREKSHNRSHIKNNLEVSELTLSKNDNQNGKPINLGSGPIQKIGKAQKSKEDWINIATNEVKQDISNSDDVSLLKSVENESVLTEKTIANIINQLRDILTEEDTDTDNEDSREHIHLLQKYISSELEPHAVKPAIQTSQTYTDKTSTSLFVDSSLKHVSSIRHLQNNNSVLPLAVRPVSSPTSASVESEYDMLSSETSHIINKSTVSDHVTSSDSSSFLSQSQDSYSNHYGSKEYVTSPTYPSQSQMSGSVQDDSRTSDHLLLNHDSSTSIYDNSDDEDDSSELYNKREKVLAEKDKYDSLQISNEMNNSLLSSTEIKNVVPLTTTEAPILDTRATLVTESDNIINIYGLSENSVLPNITGTSDSNEIANVTKLYKVLTPGVVLNISRKFPPKEIHSLGTVPKDVTDILANILLSDSDLDVSDHISEQNVIDNLFDDIAQELGDTIQGVAEAANANGLSRKKSNIGNVARNRHDRAVKTYNLAFHFNK